MVKQKIGLSWPLGIGIFYAFFVIVFVSYAIYANFNSVDLVSADYYMQEIQYQQHIDRVDRTRMLEQKLVMDYDKLEKKLNIQFPADIPRENIKGKIVFFRPSDAKLDLSTNIAVLNDGSQTIDVSNLKKGMWRVKIFWRVIEREYYSEKIVMVN